MCYVTPNDTRQEIVGIAKAKKAGATEGRPAAKMKAVVPVTILPGCLVRPDEGEIRRGLSPKPNIICDGARHTR